MGLAPLHPNIPTSKASFRFDPRSLRLRQNSEQEISRTGDYWHIQCIQWLSAAPQSTAAPAKPKAERKKIPKYSNIHSNNLRVSGSEMGHDDGQSEGHKGLDCMTFAGDRSSGDPELRPRVGETGK